MTISVVDPRDGYRSLKQKIKAYTTQDGKVTHIAIGTETKVGYSIVVEVKTGIVKFVDDESGKNEKSCTFFGRIYKRVGTMGLVGV